MPEPITVFPARKIITMNPSLPEASAVAVRDGAIIEVGSLDSMSPWLDVHPHDIDHRFANAVLTPGFIDPHLHPSMAAVLLPMEFVTAMEWKLPWGRVAPTLTPEAFDARLTQLHKSRADPAEPLFVWGYHHLWHGPMNRARINAVSQERPIIVWHRSFHELYMNDGALTWLEFTEARVGNRQQINYAEGHFFENGLGVAISGLNPHILSPERFGGGLGRVKEVIRAGGHTTVGDMAVGLFDFDMEWTAFNEHLDTAETPFRIELVPHGGVMLRNHGKAGVLDYFASLPDRNTHRLRFSDHVKLFADGAMFSQLAQMHAPGYIDGHLGEWLSPPDTLEEQVRLFWHAGAKIHVHCCGDLAVELTLDILEKMQSERPRFNHGFTLEHFGFSTPEQIIRLRQLGANVSANVYYLHELSEIYSTLGIGYERASQMARVKSCFDAGITTTFHSDFTMAPAEPLNSAWVAANRITCEGNVMGAEERLSSAQALAAITINAAWVLGRQNEIGSIRSGKRADFTILEEDPLAIDPTGLKDIGILGTVFEGTHFPAT